MKSYHKRQVLANLFMGKLQPLQAYKAKERDIHLTYRWAIHDTIEEKKYLINSDGSCSLLFDEEYEQLPNRAKYTIIDFLVS